MNVTKHTYISFTHIVFFVLFFVSLFFFVTTVFAEQGETERAYLRSVGIEDFEAVDLFFNEQQALNETIYTEEERIEMLKEIQNVTFSDSSFFGPSIPATPETAGTVSCFDYYDFGSVFSAINTSIQSAVTGTAMTFDVEITNDNPYPVVDGTLYVKIFREQIEEDFTYTQANHVIDQWKALENITLHARETKEYTITWDIPGYIGSGTYYAATYFATNDRYNLSGLSFTDDIIGGSTDLFTITSEVQPIYFDKNKVMLNGQAYRFIGPPLAMLPDGDVVITFPVVNESDKDQTVTINWTVNEWDTLRTELILDTYTEMLEVSANTSIQATYTVSDIGAPVYLIEPRLSVRDQTVSVMNIRFVRSDTNVPRINFPSIMSYPLKKGVENTLFSCLHNAGQAAAVEGGELTLTLTDGKGKEIHTYTYTGIITGAMMGLKDTFTPKKDITDFTLRAVLKVDGEVLEDVSIEYTCADITPEMDCSIAGVGGFGEASGRTTPVIVIVIIILALIILVVIVRSMKNRPQTESIDQHEYNAEDSNNTPE